MQLNALTLSHGLQQLVNEQASILPSSSCCIDLIFTNHPSLVVNFGTHSSFHVSSPSVIKCHHRITYCKVNVKIEYHPPYQCQCGTLKKPISPPLEKPYSYWEFLFFNKSVLGPLLLVCINDLLDN